MGNAMPALFIGHGSPENAREDNEFTRNWKKTAELIPKPSAILSISAHWLTDLTEVTSMQHPKMIYDFYGFPDELYRIKYSAAGSPEFAGLIKENIRSVETKQDKEWGLDHGTWSVLVHMYPKADIPVLQLSIPYDSPFDLHYKIGKELRKLREKGVLIMGSGNIVHNLQMMDFSGKTYGWAKEFDVFVKSALEKRDDMALVNFLENKSALLAHPTYDHYLPLLYVLGATENEKPMFFNDKFVYGSLSMRCAVFDST